MSRFFNIFLFDEAVSEIQIMRSMHPDCLDLYQVDSPNLENFTFEVGRTNPKGVLRSTLFTGLCDENDGSRAPWGPSENK